MANQKFKTKIQADAGVSLPAQSASKALQLDSSGNAESSVVTSAELAQLSGVTSPVQAQITAAQSDATQALSDAADAQADIDSHIALATGAHAASAIAVTPAGNLASTQVQAALEELQGDLDAISADTRVASLVTLSGVAANSTDLGTFSGSIIPDTSTVKAALQALETELETIPDPIYYAGVYDASTNTPPLANTDVGQQGALYYVTVAGSQDFGAGSITLAVGDKVVNNGTTYDKWDDTSDVVSVNGQQGVVVLDTDDVAEGSTNLYFSDERSQDAVGAMIASTDTVTLTYTDGTPELKADVVSQMSITSDASGIKLVNDAATPGNTQYYGTDASGVKGFHAIPAVGSAGDIQETSFSAANNQAVAADVTGLAFSNAVVRSFEAQVSIAINAASSLFEVYKLSGIQKGASWDMSISSVGDDSGISFSITALGQVQYTSTNESVFVSNTMKFRALTTSV